MKNKYYLLFSSILILTGCSSVKESKYSVIEKDGSLEVRDYAPQIIAETAIDGTLENAGNKAFGRLFSYISGNNQSQAKIAMTAPVSQQASEKISMTAPVSQKKKDDKWLISFMMPVSYTMKTIPKPKDSRVFIRQIPEQRIAAIRYSGSWSAEAYNKNKSALESWIKKKEFIISDEPVWARYNSPFTLWFLRRNEVLIPIKKLSPLP